MACVNVFFFSLDPPVRRLAVLERCLSKDELVRADRFHFQQHRRRFVAARGQLRELLGREIGLSPESLRFCYGPHGKPGIEQTEEISFNLSHSNEAALLATCRGAALGVDLEWIERRVEYLLVARRFFSEQEVRKLDHCPPEHQREAFFACWTRKEAYIKALGEGLSRPLDSFAVGMLRGEPATLLWSRFPGEPERWSLHNLVLPGSYRGALAVEGQGWEVVIREIDPRGSPPYTTGAPRS